ncbi:hypothetical protein DFJ77DRAFT_317806 [Powellomyces hirtus]|nr:hypothetical protein DFJ77DRAFT_317806 [Powellomyces hirtus]
METINQSMNMLAVLADADYVAPPPRAGADKNSCIILITLHWWMSSSHMAEMLRNFPGLMTVWTCHETDRCMALFVNKFQAEEAASYLNFRSSLVAQQAHNQCHCQICTAVERGRDFSCVQRHELGAIGDLNPDAAEFVPGGVSLTIEDVTLGETQTYVVERPTPMPGSETSDNSVGMAQAALPLDVRIGSVERRLAAASSMAPNGEGKDAVMVREHILKQFQKNLVKSYTERIRDLETRIETLQQEKLQREREALKAAAADGQLDANVTIANLEQKHETLQQEKAHTGRNDQGADETHRSQIRPRDQSIEELRKKNRALQEELDQARETDFIHQAEIVQLNVRNEGLVKRVTNLQEELAAGADRETGTKEISDVVDTLTLRNKDLETKVRNLEAELREAAQNEAELRKQISALHDDNDQRAFCNGELETELADVKRQLKEETATLDAQNAELDSLLQEQTTKKIKLETIVVTLTSENKEMQLQLDVQDARLKEQQIASDARIAELESAQERLAVQARKIADERNKVITGLRNELKAEEEEHDKAEAALKRELEAQKREHEDIVAKVQRERDAQKVAAADGQLDANVTIAILEQKLKKANAALQYAEARQADIPLLAEETIANLRHELEMAKATAQTQDVPAAVPTRTQKHDASDLIAKLQKVMPNLKSLQQRPQSVPVNEALAAALMERIVNEAYNRLFNAAKAKEVLQDRGLDPRDYPILDVEIMQEAAMDAAFKLRKPNGRVCVW